MEMLSRAYMYAASFNYTFIGTEHILLALTDESLSPVNEILDRHGVSKKDVMAEIVKVAGREPGAFVEREADPNQIFTRCTNRTKRLLYLAEYLTKKEGKNVVEPEHVLLAILRDGQCTAYRILAYHDFDAKSASVDLIDILRERAQDAGAEYDEGEDNDTDDDDEDEDDEEEDEDVDPVSRFFGGNSVKRRSSKKDSDEKEKNGKTKTLDKYCKDLTEEAKAGRIDPVIGREEEIARVMQILVRRTKNNPVLIGEPGVGKTAIAEGLAVKMMNNDVPDLLAGKRVLSLDLSSMVAGTKYRGEFEDRFKKSLEEATKAGNVILFIDELHTIMGAGNSEGAMDAANMLKPLLARGELHVIGATTLDEYRKRIEKDSALERRFQKVLVKEPSTTDTILILKGIRSKFEEHHGIKIPDDAIDQAVILSSRYITDRFLPDKAIDLIDEAASRLRIKASTEPDETKKIGERINEIMRLKQEAVNNQDFETAQKLRDEETLLEEKLSTLRQQVVSSDKKELALTPDDIADIVANWTGIPVKKITESDAERLKTLEEELKKRVIGQDEAVTAISKAIRRSRLGLKDPKRPSGSFIFLGTTGVGKTELAKALAEVMFGNENALIRVDMSEYMEKHDVSKLIGSPPGYVGYDEGGQLTEKVRRMPYSVVLFDEIEKAHPEIFNSMLQILDDGRLTDGQGRVVDFKNTIIIMTSNIGARMLTTSAGRHIGFSIPTDKKDDPFADEADTERLYGGKSYGEAKEVVMEELKKAFNPEFLNRVDEIIFFRMLGKKSILQIVDLLTSGLRKRVKELGIDIELTDEARELLAKKGYDPQYGARPLKRVIQSMVEDKFSEALLDRVVASGETAIVDVENDEIVIKKKETRQLATADVEE